MTTVFVSGALANKPMNGGNAWTRLCWILGLQQLGYEVFFVEQISRQTPIAPAKEYFTRVMDQFKLTGNSSLLFDDGECVCGVDFETLCRKAENAALLLNISGHLTVPEINQCVACRVYYDDDPGYTQFWHASGESAARLEGHDFFYTLGANIGKPDCLIPKGTVSWRPIRPPVFLPEWIATKPASPENFFTTVASWRGPYAPMQHNGKTYGVKAHEFRTFIDLPERTGCSFELALHIHDGDSADKQSLLKHGWKLTDPVSLAGTPDSYRTYIQQSGAEFSVAQGIYTETNSGWFSDRTARYLASGRPALVQETGFSETIPTGEGLISFRTIEEAVDGAQRIVRDYELHAKQARQVAEQHFDAVKIISGIIKDTGAPPAHEK